MTDTHRKWRLNIWTLQWKALNWLIKYLIAIALNVVLSWSNYNRKLVVYIDVKSLAMHHILILSVEHLIWVLRVSFTFFIQYIILIHIIFSHCFHCFRLKSSFCFSFPLLLLLLSSLLLLFCCFFRLIFTYSFDVNFKFLLCFFLVFLFIMSSMSL